MHSYSCGTILLFTLKRSPKGLYRILMQVNKRTLENVFDPSLRLVAPLFQRPYVWKQEENWQPLWTPIEEIAERRLKGLQMRPHFLGAVVLDRVDNATGTIDTREIIDGQQRLTTLQLLIAAARDYCALFDKDFQAAFAKLTVNNVPLSKDPNDKFKVWPTNVDRSRFQTVMTAGSFDAVYKAYGAKLVYQDNGLLSKDPVVQGYLTRRASLSDEDCRAAYRRLSSAQRKEATPNIEQMKRV
jgi:hypothetical protein